MENMFYLLGKTDHLRRYAHHGGINRLPRRSCLPALVPRTAPLRCLTCPGAAGCVMVTRDDGTRSHGLYTYEFVHLCHFTRALARCACMIYGVCRAVTDFERYGLRLILDQRLHYHAQSQNRTVTPLRYLLYNRVLGATAEYRVLHVDRFHTLEHQPCETYYRVYAFDFLPL